MDSNSDDRKDTNAKFYIQTKLCSSYVIMSDIQNAWDIAEVNDVLIQFAYENESFNIYKIILHKK